MALSIPFHLRPIQPGDLNYVMSSWIQGNKDSVANYFRDWNEYQPAQQAVIEKLLARGATIIVACSTEWPTEIIGWICFEHITSASVDSNGKQGVIPVVHWVCVKTEFRHHGICKRLLVEAGAVNSDLNSQQAGVNPSPDANRDRSIYCSHTSNYCFMAFEKVVYKDFILRGRHRKQDSSGNPVKIIHVPYVLE